MPAPASPLLPPSLPFLHSSPHLPTLASRQVEVEVELVLVSHPLEIWEPAEHMQPALPQRGSPVLELLEVAVSYHPSDPFLASSYPSCPYHHSFSSYALSRQVCGQPQGRL